MTVKVECVLLLSDKVVTSQSVGGSWVKCILYWSGELL